MSSQLVSIVLPTYNGSNYIEQSINSCINQTYHNWELIIVDDCSTDNTAIIIEEYIKKDSRIKTIKHKTNLKLPTALNTGFAEAGGDYLTWTSDDNLFLPNAIKKMVSFLIEKPQFDIVYCDYSFIDDAGKIIHDEKVMPPEFLAIGNCIRCCFLYRSKVMHEIGGYSSDLYLSEDYDYWLRASINHRFARLNMTLYLYRKHAESLTSKHTDLIATATYTTLEKNLPRMKWLSNEMKSKGYLRLTNLVPQSFRSKRLLFFIHAVLFSPTTVLMHFLKKIIRLFK